MSIGEQQHQSQLDYSIEDCTKGLLNQAEEFYIFLVDRFVCEIINGSVTDMETGASPPELQLEGDKQ